VRVDIRTADCLEEMHTMPGCSVDAIVCDPPYGMSFMGKEWDHGIPGRPFWRRALRVAKPGAPLLAFGGTRTHHRLMCAIEDAGWEIRDCLMWLYGSGFPKSLDVGKALDKAAGAEREVVGRDTAARGAAGLNRLRFQHGTRPAEYDQGTGCDITAPATDAARRWHGYGTALKPAWEPIILARKPLDGTVAANVGKWGVAGVNVEGCRVGPGHANGRGRDGHASGERRYTGNGAVNFAAKPGPLGGAPTGRFPANLILDEGAAAALDEQVGERKSGMMRAGTPRANRNGYAGPMPGETAGDTYGDTGGASRFFYCAKASSADRNEGLGGADGGGDRVGNNPHPT